LSGDRAPSDDDLVTLAEACELFFGGRLTKSSLRLEASRGNLAIVRIANKDFVTRRGVNEMISRCTLDKSAVIKEQEAPRPSAQEALRTMLKQRKAADQRERQEAAKSMFKKLKETPTKKS